MPRPAQYLRMKSRFLQHHNIMSGLSLLPAPVLLVLQDTQGILDLLGTQVLLVTQDILDLRGTQVLLDLRGTQVLLVLLATLGLLVLQDTSGQG